MFQRTTKTGSFGRLCRLLTTLYHSTVRRIRKQHGSPVMGLILNILQTVLLVGVFYIMFGVLGLRGSAVRGDFMLFLMSGIFLFLTFNKAMAAIVGAESATSTMMLHAPMNTMVAIWSAAFSVLYTQVLSAVVVITVYHLAWGPIVIEQPLAAFSMLLLSWFSGVSVGLIFLAMKPWAPHLVAIIVQVYSRANMIASGKMFLANTVPGSVRVYFDWNPLFHTIDQARGFTFINYNPHYSSTTYPLYLSLILLLIGFTAEHATRQRMSLSWSAGK